MMEKWTPGPWEFLENGCAETEHNVGKPLTIAGAGNDDLANIFSRDDTTVSISRTEAIANAYLIAAAPDLYEALAEHLMCTEEIEKAFGHQLKRGDRARAALSRARGEA